MKRLWWVISAVFALPSCAFGPSGTTRTDETVDVSVFVVDEGGAPVPDADFDYRSGSARADDSGWIALELNQPIAGVITADGKLDEPLVVSPRDRELRVRLIDRQSSTGQRTTLHFGGDVMLGRRYQAPNREGTAVATDADSARAVVSDLAPVAAAADVTIVNAETVIGELPLEDAYPGKRFLIQSPPSILDALDELGVDGVTLGNNHAADWLDAGVEATLEVLDEAGMPQAGAGLTAEEAIVGMLLPAGDKRVGVVSVTTVNGDFVNDQLPLPGDAVPLGLPPTDAWQYEVRTFGFGPPGEPGSMRTTQRLPSEAWREYVEIEAVVAPDAAAELWAALTAPGAFPELQDWTARRGHGGAAGYDRRQVADEIRRLRDEGAHVVVVQFHGGFQFAEVKSSFVRRISHAAVDDGADLVVSHHPHVLQGAEWYAGRLIAYSLGNLVFDQDFLDTFPTALLRVVIDDAGVVEARFLPVMIVDYRPVPVAGDAAERVVRMIDTRSALPAESERIDGFEVGGVLLPDLPPRVEPASVQLDRNTGVIGAGRVESVATLTAGPELAATLPPCLVLRADRLPPDIEYGVDLFDWGRFDDMTADRARGRPMHWIPPASIDDWDVSQGLSLDPTDDALTINTDANRPVRTRFVARVGLADHRLYDTDDARPADTTATHTIEFDAKRSRGAAASVRIDVFDVDDADPTSDPTSTLLRSVVLPLDIAESEEWRHYVVDLEDTFEPEADLTADAAMFTVITEPAFRGRFTFDNVRVLEWRGAPTTALPLWAEVDALRAVDVRAVDVTVSGCENV